MMAKRSTAIARLPHNNCKLSGINSELSKHIQMDPV